MVGILLPILPTTPFMLLSAFFFARSSPRAHRWLLARPVVGKLILDWQEHGVIRLRAKLMATTAIGLLVGVRVWMNGFVLDMANIFLFILIVVAMNFIWSRPSVPRKK